MNIVFIGAGNIGGAIRSLIKEEYCVAMWDINPVVVPDQKALEDIVPQADMIFFCLQTHFLRSSIKPLLDFLKPETIIVSVSKSIEAQTNFFVDELLKDALPNNQPFALMHGPMLAKEIACNQGSAAVIATMSEQDFKTLANLFLQSKIKLQYSNDVHGTAIAGVLKNVYAIALGIAYGLGWCNNRKGWLVASSISEMQSIISKLGSDPKTALSLAGIGDLIATGFSKLSGNQTLGRNLAKTNTYPKTSEGCMAFPSLWALLEGKTSDLPVITALEKILIQKQEAKNVFEELFQNL